MSTNRTGTLKKRVDTPKKKGLPIWAWIILIVIGGYFSFSLIWLMFSANVGGAMRPDTPEEAKEKRYQQEELARAQKSKK